MSLLVLFKWSGLSYAATGNSVGLSTATLSDKAKRPLVGTASGTAATSADLQKPGGFSGVSRGTSATAGAAGHSAPAAGT